MRNRLRRLLRSLYVWHRYVGLVAAVFVIIFTLTGLLLNHTETLRLDERHIGNTWILKLYGIETPAIESAYRVEATWYARAGDRLYRDGQALPVQSGELRGAVGIPMGHAVAWERGVLLLDAQGSVIDQLDASVGLPVPVLRLGVDTSGRLWVQGENSSYQADADGLQWQVADAGETVQWSAAMDLPGSQRQSILQAHRGQGLSLERVLLDLHSGRLFGSYGVYVMDAAAFALLFLASTGVVMWWRFHRRKGHGRKRA